MTQAVNDRRIQYIASSSQTIFVYDFKIFDQEEITVIQNDETLVLTTDYTIDGVGDEDGGNVTLVTGATSGDVITIIGNTPISRATDFTNSGNFFSSDLNTELDRLIQINQQLSTLLLRSLRLQDDDTSNNCHLPLKDTRKSKYLAFDVNGDPIASDAVTDTTPITALGESIVQQDTASQVRTLLDIQQYSALLQSLVNLSTSGLLVKSGSSVIKRDIAASGMISVTNGDGQSGNPTLSLSAASQAEVNAGSVSDKPIVPLTYSSMPSFSATMSADQTVSSGVMAKVQFNIKTFETGGSYYDTSLYRWTPPAGYYFIGAGFMVTGSQLFDGFLEIRKNGTSIKNDIITANSAGGLPTVGATAYTYLNGTDYVEIYGAVSLAAAGTAQLKTGPSNFYGIKVR